MLGVMHDVTKTDALPAVKLYETKACTFCVMSIRKMSKCLKSRPRALWHDEEKHYNDVNEWLARMYETRFPPNWNESEVAVDVLNWCGVSVEKKGIRQVKERVEALSRLRDPNNYEEAERLIGLFNHHRYFVEKFAGYMNPIYKVQSEERWRKKERKKQKNGKDR